jgi:hypothetical protein
MENEGQENESDGMKGGESIAYRACKERILTQLIAAAKKEREQFLKEGDQINVFAFGGKDKIAEHLDSQVPHIPCLTKASQFVDIIGTQLYEQNPTRRVEPRKYSPEGALMRAIRMEEYLNYIPRETNLKTHCKRALIQACIYGKGVLWTGWDKEKNIVTSVFDMVQNLLVDPDASNPEEANWKARERKKPRWWLSKAIPEAKDLIKLAAPSSKKARSSKGNDYTTETISFYEIYMRIGLHNYDGGSELLRNEEGGVEAKGDDTPMVYVMTSDGKLLQEREWEVPLYIKGLWPCTEIDFKENPGHYWSKSPMWPGISQLQNMNWLYRHMMARVRQAARGFLMMMTQNGVTVESEDIDRLLDIAPTPDGVWDLIRIKAGAMGEGVNINQIIQKLELQANTEQFLTSIEFEDLEFAKATGLYGILFQGQTETQMRSAKEVQFREKTSRSRLEDMQKSVETWSDVLATTQAAYAKFLSTEEDIIPILGEQGAKEFGFLIPSMEEEAKRMTLELVSRGAPADMAPQLAQMQAEAQELEYRQQGGTTFEEWAKESTYTIQGGSTRRKDVDEEKEVYAEAANQLEPALFKSGNPALMLVALRIAHERFELNGASQLLLNDIEEAMRIIAETPPPLPPPPGGGGPQPGASPEAPPQGV